MNEPNVKGNRSHDKPGQFTPPEDKSGQVGNQRNYGIDLLRMVSMYMVCMLHTLGCGGILAGTAADSVKHCIAWFVEIVA